MPGQLDHSPADIVRWLLVDMGLGSDPNNDPLLPFPIYASNEPDYPDECITVYDTTGRDHGRTQTDGERQEIHGIQIRVRGPVHNFRQTLRSTGYRKARQIALALDENVYQEVVGVEHPDTGTSTLSYLVHQVSRTSDVLSLGKETPTSKRSLFTINAVVSVRRVS